MCLCVTNQWSQDGNLHGLFQDAEILSQTLTSLAQENGLDFCWSERMMNEMVQNIFEKLGYSIQLILFSDDHNMFFFFFRFASLYLFSKSLLYIASFA